MGYIQIPWLLKGRSYLFEKLSEDIVNFDTIRIRHTFIILPNRVFVANIENILFYWLITRHQKFNLFLFGKVFIDHLHNDFNSLFLLGFFILVYFQIMEMLIFQVFLLQKFGFSIMLCLHMGVQCWVAKIRFAAWTDEISTLLIFFCTTSFSLSFHLLRP